MSESPSSHRRTTRRSACIERGGAQCDASRIAPSGTHPATDRDPEEIDDDRQLGGDRLRVGSTAEPSAHVDNHASHHTTQVGTLSDGRTGSRRQCGGVGRQRTRPGRLDAWTPRAHDGRRGDHAPADAEEPGHPTPDPTMRRIHATARSSSTRPTARHTRPGVVFASTSRADASDSIVNTRNTTGASPTTHAESRAWVESARASASTARRSSSDAARPSSAAALGPPIATAIDSAPAVARRLGQSEVVGPPGQRVHERGSDPGLVDDARERHRDGPGSADDGLQLGGDRAPGAQPVGDITEESGNGDHQPATSSLVDRSQQERKTAHRGRHDPDRGDR